MPANKEPEVRLDDVILWEVPDPNELFNKVAPDEVCYCGWDGIDSDGCTCLTAAADIEE